MSFKQKQLSINMSHHFTPEAKASLDLPMTIWSSCK